MPESTAGEPEPILTDVLDRLQVTLSEPIDFQATDTDSTLAKVRLLVAAAT